MPVVERTTLNRGSIILLVEHKQHAGFYATVGRDKQGTWRGRVHILWDVSDGSSQSAGAFSIPKRASEGEAIMYAEQKIARVLSQLRAFPDVYRNGRSSYNVERHPLAQDAGASSGVQS